MKNYGFLCFLLLLLGPGCIKRRPLAGLELKIKLSVNVIQILMEIMYAHTHTHTLKYSQTAYVVMFTVLIHQPAAMLVKVTSSVMLQNHCEGSVFFLPFSFSLLLPAWIPRRSLRREREIRAPLRKQFWAWLLLLLACPLFTLCISVWADSAGWTKLNMIRQKKNSAEEEQPWLEAFVWDSFIFFVNLCKLFVSMIQRGPGEVVVI